jgi:hypothetical protein
MGISCAPCPHTFVLATKWAGTGSQTEYRWDMMAFIQCITMILESSKSYTCKMYVDNIGAYPRQTSIIVLR